MRRVTLSLTPQQAAELAQLAESDANTVVRQRAQALLHLAGDHGLRGAARLANVNESAIRKWRAAYDAAGADGLQPKARSGRPRRVSAADTARLSEALAQSPRDVGLSGDVWSARLLNEHLHAHSTTRVSDWTIWSHTRRQLRAARRGASVPPQPAATSSNTRSSHKEVDAMPNTLSVWEPMRDLVTLSRTMDRLLDESGLLGRAPYRPTNGGTLYLPLDVYTTDDEVVVLASLPGMTADDVELIWQGDTLTIRGEIKPPVGNVQWAFQERPYGRFSRSLTLNIPMDTSRAEATFENGVLKLTLPKAEAAKPRQIQITSKGAQATIEGQSRTK